MRGFWSPHTSTLVAALVGVLLLKACADSGTVRAPAGPSSAGEGGESSPPVTPQEPGAPVPDPNPVTPQEPGGPDPSGGAASFNPLCGTGACIPDALDCEDADDACRVQSQDGEPVTVCAPAGPNRLDEPCFSASDCQAGYACIGAGLTGRCRPYCCHGPSSCDTLSGTYCAPQAQRVNGDDESPEEPLIVPVCIPADDCDLTDPYPCAAGRSCGCPDGKACLVVRTADASQNPLGSTACIEPGPGKLGDFCPIEGRPPRPGQPAPKICGHGLVCSRATGRCIQLCSTLGVGINDCPGRCQASPALPAGWGVCIEP